MENNDFFELETFNEINDFNKKIYRLEAQMRMIFFENVDITSSEKIVPPIISTKGYSDFERIKYEIKMLELETKEIDKKLENLQSFSNLVIKNLQGKELSREEYDRLKREILRKIELELKEQRNFYLEKIASIERNPLAYLRFLEFQSCDFSNVEDDEIRENLEQQNKILKGYIYQRNSLLKRIKKYQKKNEKHILQIKLKSNKKSIDKKQ